MSTKMYVYRIPKDQWWGFAAYCREQYLKGHPMCEVLNKMAGESSPGKMRELVESLVDNEWTVELQLFDEGDSWLIRPLERGWFFNNSADKWAEEGCYALEAVTYDNRSDVPPEGEKNKLVAEWIDKQIGSGLFFTFAVLNKYAFDSIWIDALVGRDKGVKV